MVTHISQSHGWTLQCNLYVFNVISICVMAICVISIYVYSFKCLDKTHQYIFTRSNYGYSNSSIMIDMVMVHICKVLLCDLHMCNVHLRDFQLDHKTDMNDWTLHMIRNVQGQTGMSHWRDITHDKEYSVFFFIRPQKQGCCELNLGLLRSPMASMWPQDWT